MTMAKMPTVIPRSESTVRNPFARKAEKANRKDSQNKNMVESYYASLLFIYFFT
jgi:hypothetical protein